MNLEFLKERKKEILIALAIVLVVIYSLISNTRAFTKEKDEKEIEETLIQERYEEEIFEESKIYIHLDGAVKSSGLIELVEGDRLEKAIKKAGGLTEKADLRYVNLAMVLSDGEKIYIPNIDELVDYSYGVSYMPDIQEVRKININRADITELTNIPGIGESTAGKIVDYRKKNGNFKSLEDIKNVSGIGDAKFEGMLEYISI